MKKKGFTLVELLAVIAILAILVIIALPNIMDLFNDAKKNSFKNEVKEIFKTAESQWLSDSMAGASTKLYGRGVDYTEDNTCQSHVSSLSLSGRTNIDFGIVFNSSGEVIDYHVTDGTYAFNHSDGVLTIDGIVDAKFSDVDETFIVTCGGEYAFDSYYN